LGDVPTGVVGKGARSARPQVLGLFVWPLRTGAPCLRSQFPPPLRDARCRSGSFLLKAHDARAFKARRATGKDPASKWRVKGSVLDFRPVQSACRPTQRIRMPEASQHVAGGERSDTTGSERKCFPASRQGCHRWQDDRPRASKRAKGSALDFRHLSCVCATEPILSTSTPPDTLASRQDPRMRSESRAPAPPRGGRMGKAPFLKSRGRTPLLPPG